MRRALGGLALAAAAAFGPAAAAAVDASLDAARAQIDAAAAALDGAAGDAARLDALSRAIAAYQQALVELRGAVVGAEGEEQALMIEFALRRAEIERLLAGLQAMGRTPPPAQALHPQGPIGAARASAMLSALTPALAAEADRLAARLAAIAEAQALRDQGLAELSEGLETLGTAREALLAALAARDSAGAAAEEGAADVAGADAAAALARDSETLSAFSDRLAALGPAAPATPAATGPLALGWPVAGRVARGFREPDAAGVRRPGIAIEAAPLSLVVAPVRARVRYAGPFLDYGYVVVLEPRADTLLVLAGLATLETRAGAAVEAGAPLGLLGGRALDAQEFLMLAGDASGETPGETLYIEVRQGQGPVDPTPLFTDGNG